MSLTTTKDAALAQVKAAFGFVPNLMAEIVEQTKTVAAANLASSAGLEGGLPSATETHVVELTEVDTAFKAQAKREIRRVA